MASRLWITSPLWPGGFAMAVVLLLCGAAPLAGSGPEAHGPEPAVPFQSHSFQDPTFQDGPSREIGADTLRPLQPEDLFRVHKVGDVRFSPDGNQVAYELSRPGEKGPVKRLPRFLEAHSDIWIVSGKDAEPRQLTSGAVEGTGWFHPRWSPGGEHLAFLSVDGNDVQAWIWTRGEEKPRRLTERQVHLTSTGPLLFRWVSERKLALGLRPEGAEPNGRLLAEQTRPGAGAAQAWEASWRGTEVTADVFEGGMETDNRQQLSRAELVLFNTDGSAQTAATGWWGLAVPSPDGRWAATLSEPPVGSVPPQRSLQQKMTFASRPGAVPLATKSGPAASGKALSWDALDDPMARTLRWAPDGSAFALLTRSFSGEGKSPERRVAVARPGEEELLLVGNPEMQVSRFAWTGGGTLLVRARPSGDDTETDEYHWWKPPEGTDEAGTDGAWEKWTAGMETVPDKLVAVSGGAVGVAGGALWRLDEGGPERILNPEGAAARRLVGPAPPFGIGPAPPQDRSPTDPLRVLSVTEDGPELWAVRPEAGGGETGGAETVSRLPMPEGARRPADVAPEGTAAAFSSSGETGTWLLQSRLQEPKEPFGDQGAAPTASVAALDTLVARDQWLEEIDQAEARRLTYAGPDGGEHAAWILLPPDREPGEAHPTVAWIYPGQTHGKREPGLAGLSTRALTNGIGALQVLAARGYAVLFPSVPLGSGPLGSGEESARPKLAEKVLPAVDRAAEEGLTDTSRVGVMGHSYGGFGVNHLVSQTDRFEAAVSLASISHLRSFYGTLDARSRYGHMKPALSGQLFTQGYFETGQGRMGAPPALAPERYRKASPLTYVDEARVPLMLIHGDQDHIPVQQAEMLFNELVRLGKPAQMVRYAGEGHLIVGRANVLDMWNRIFNWFGEHLGDPREPSS